MNIAYHSKNKARFISLFLCVVFIMLTPFKVIAANNSYQNIYEAELTEYVEINGSRYSYNYSYTPDFQKQIRITNETTGTYDILYFDGYTGDIYLNNTLIGHVGEKKLCPYNDTSLELSRAWTYDGYYNTYITWAQGISGMVLAAIIAGCMNGVTAAMVSARVTITVLGAIAGMCAGMNIYYFLYYMESDTGISFWYHWKFIPATGETYGWYDSYASFTY